MFRDNNNHNPGGKNSQTPKNKIKEQDFSNRFPRFKILFPN